MTILNIKYELLAPLNNVFYFDFYAGLGIRLKRFKDISIEFNPDLHRTYYEDNIFSLDFLDGTYSDTIKMSLGLKFGIIL
ncbi:hypothetical protein DUT90_09010 [Polaribacter sp. WD7]|nr:hypothetical protein DUT90_09010 [Polaribacter sp. WD7]